MMQKSIIWKKNKVECVKNERNVLAKHATSYIVKLMYSFQDQKNLYLAMEYCPGGDLRRLLDALHHLEEHETRLYLAEMILAVHSLHKLGYIHRDLKPDNFLIDSRGHLKLTDFGLSKEGFSTRQLPVASPLSSTQHFSRCFNSRRQLAFSVVGSPNYMSPEVLQGESKGYGVEVDWWSIGCIFFEMLAGYPPFMAETAVEVFAKIFNWRSSLSDALNDIRWKLSDAAVNLLTRFLCEPEKRLGVHDIDEIKRHPFFAGLQWDNLQNETPLFVPKLKHEADTSYFEINSPVTKDKNEIGSCRASCRPGSETKENCPPGMCQHVPPATPPQTLQSPPREILGFSFKRKQNASTRAFHDSPPVWTSLRQRLNFGQLNTEHNI